MKGTKNIRLASSIVVIRIGSGSVRPTFIVDLVKQLEHMQF